MFRHAGRKARQLAPNALPSPVSIGAADDIFAAVAFFLFSVTLRYSSSSCCLLFPVDRTCRRLCESVFDVWSQLAAQCDGWVSLEPLIATVVGARMSPAKHDLCRFVFDRLPMESRSGIPPPTASAIKDGILLRNQKINIDLSCLLFLEHFMH